MGTTNVMNGLNYSLVRLIRTSKMEEFICELNQLLENDKPYPQIVIILEDVSGELVNLEIKRIKRMCNEVHVTKDKSEAIGMAINCIDKLTEAIRVTETKEIMKDLLEETETGRIWILENYEDIENFEKHLLTCPERESKSYIIISTIKLSPKTCENMSNHGVSAIYHGIDDEKYNRIVRKLKNQQKEENDKENLNANDERKRREKF